MSHPYQEGFCTQCTPAGGPPTKCDEIPPEKDYRVQITETVVTTYIISHEAAADEEGAERIAEQQHLHGDTPDDVEVTSRFTNVL